MSLSGVIRVPHHALGSGHALVDGGEVKPQDGAHGRRADRDRPVAVALLLVSDCRALSAHTTEAWESRKGSFYKVTGMG